MQQVYQQQLIHQQQQFKLLNAMKNTPDGQPPPVVNTLTQEQVTTTTPSPIGLANAISKPVLIIGVCIMCKSRFSCSLGSLASVFIAELFIDDPQYLSLCCVRYILFSSPSIQIQRLKCPRTLASRSLVKL